MKKLMIGLAAVAMGIVANAAQYSWSSAGSFFDGTGGLGKMADGTSVYLMFESAYAQDALVADFAAGTISKNKAIATDTISGAKLNGGNTISTSYETSSSQTAYMVILYGDRMFISSTTSAEYTSVGEGPIAFDTQAYLTRYNNTEKVLLPDNLASNGYSGAGWYAVPEPTSGLLLLIGMAGLALKRKRA